MEYIIKGRKPEQIFRFFEEIAAIPHGSGNEKGIADYLEKFAADRDLFCVHDEIHNIFIKKPATKGRENEPAVLFQAHTDMVCEKNADTVHDFLTDPLELYLDGKYLRARGTTLGADDGIGVTTMLALLDGAVASHPAIECLFTVSEETGMDGVNGFDFSLVKARKMINLDSEEIEYAIAGCAGGVRNDLIINAKKEPAKGSALKISLGGLAGGHSGVNIADGRANANKLIGRVLLALSDIGYKLVSLNGGGKSNAIPREACAVIVTDVPDKIIAEVKKHEADISFELADCDKSFFLSAESVSLPAESFDKATTESAVRLLAVVDNGVFEMSKKIDGFIEFSRNLGVITTKEDKIYFTFFARSGIDAQLEASNRELEALAALCGADVKYYESYGGWAYTPESKVRDDYAAAYNKVTGDELKVIQIHAGLECGIVKAQIPDMDVISVGPNALNIHSPDEALDLDSVEVLAKIIEKMLA